MSPLPLLALLFCAPAHAGSMSRMPKAFAGQPLFSPAAVQPWSKAFAGLHAWTWKNFDSRWMSLDPKRNTAPLSIGPIVSQFKDPAQAAALRANLERVADLSEAEREKVFSQLTAAIAAARPEVEKAALQASALLESQDPSDFSALRRRVSEVQDVEEGLSALALFGSPKIKALAGRFDSAVTRLRRELIERMIDQGGGSLHVRDGFVVAEENPSGPRRTDAAAQAMVDEVMEDYDRLEDALIKATPALARVPGLLSTVVATVDFGRAKTFSEIVTMTVDAEAWADLEKLEERIRDLVPAAAPYSLSFRLRSAEEPADSRARKRAENVPEQLSMLTLGLDPDRTPQGLSFSEDVDPGARNMLARAFARRRYLFLDFLKERRLPESSVLSVRSGRPVALISKDGKEPALTAAQYQAAVKLLPNGPYLELVVLADARGNLELRVKAEPKTAAERN